MEENEEKERVPHDSITYCFAIQCTLNVFMASKPVRSFHPSGLLTSVSRREEGCRVWAVCGTDTVESPS